MTRGWQSFGRADVVIVTLTKGEEEAVRAVEAGVVGPWQPVPQVEVRSPLGPGPTAISGISCFALVWVIGRKRVPSPPLSIRPFKVFSF